MPAGVICTCLDQLPLNITVHFNTSACHSPTLLFVAIADFDEHFLCLCFSPHYVLSVVRYSTYSWKMTAKYAIVLSHLKGRMLTNILIISFQLSTSEALRHMMKRCYTKRCYNLKLNRSEESALSLRPFLLLSEEATESSESESEESVLSLRPFLLLPALNRYKKLKSQNNNKIVTANEHKYYLQESFKSY